MEKHRRIQTAVAEVGGGKHGRFKDAHGNWKDHEITDVIPKYDHQRVEVI